jgi:hypothetical protein
MDPNRKITKKFTKKFDSKVINRQYFNRKTGLETLGHKKNRHFDESLFTLSEPVLFCLQYFDLMIFYQIDLFQYFFFFSQ